MRRIYLYLFYCFYSILFKKDSYKNDGAISLLTILEVSLVFSIYFLIHIWFNIKIYFPLLEIAFVMVLCLIIWYLNRVYFLKRGNATKALDINKEKSELIAKSIGIFLTIAQVGIFIVSGVLTSKNVWGW